MGVEVHGRTQTKEREEEKKTYRQLYNQKIVVLAPPIE